ncbi:PTS cellobiose transporter subunit IIC [Clostridium gasigenes]|uniref:Permease IIC component n=1 Tax=Clostridium gasigenes TaxID=94869 RepID=A0A1H0U7K6_9CLOT|nr:PTS cellobiose transporter subunit IIC [Clostridium gasigenes]MBB6622881.1 PTS cellobiose transporter subunit IIC [Clostridium gasigenes]MBU3089352.1 PTS cellobiose transporter subunit IIC [Clostridium gasigenes]SDP61806.1 PTS system lichenan oligosaccharide-specific IIC component, Lac family [Clostridium gasigenes]
MQKFLSYLEEKLLPIASKLNNQRHLTAIREGVMLSLPCIMIGSVFLVLGCLPIPGYGDFMAGIFGASWLEKLLYPLGATMDLVAIFVTMGVAYSLSKAYKLDAITGTVIALSCYFVVTPFQVLFTAEGETVAHTVKNVIPKAQMGASGMFVAMIVAMICIEIYRFIIKKNIIIKMPEGVPPAVVRSFMAIIPAFVCIVVFWLLRLGIENTSFGSVHNIIFQILAKPLGAIGGSLGGAIVAIILVQLLWVLGIHGGSIVIVLMRPIWLDLMVQNTQAFQAGQPIPHIVTDQFINIFVFIGGAGVTISLVILMAFLSKSKQLKSLGKLSIGPGIFNINEPVIFGMPLVMNPIMAIPFILAPVVVAIVSYFAMSSGLVAKPVVFVDWTMIPILGGYIATGGKLSGAVLQLVNILLAMGIYYPFFKLWDKKKVEEENIFTTESRASLDT